ncbi:MAG: hypothetical protein U9R17_13765 [Thermodesulfobacteriota bacterium]|nr:hypothetical protein [Thermodesulfobacteriota bacterium]
MIKENLKIVIKEFHESALPDLIKRVETHGQYTLNIIPAWEWLLMQKTG